MKKEKSLNFLSSKWLMVTFLALGILLFSNVNANAQNGPFAERIASMTELRDSFAPGTAKYDIVQDAIDYMIILDTNSSANPNYLNDLQDQTGNNPFSANVIRKTHSTILAEYSAAQLQQFETVLGETGASQDPSSQKIQWIIEANAY